jgi:arylsulfatase A-like enzyme
MLCAAAPQRLPNVVLVLADDLGYGDLGGYNGQSRIPTPNLDRLASEALLFTDAYAPAAVCVPSRYSLLTGRYPFRGAPLTWQSAPTIPDGCMTLGELLRDRDYRTACIGKWHCGFEGGVNNLTSPLEGGPLDRGFDHFFGQHGSLDQPPYFYIHDRQAVQAPTESTPGSQEEGLSVVYQGRFWRAGGMAPGFRHDQVLDRYADHALTFLRGHRDSEKNQPFFMYLALTAPHGPWLPAKPFVGSSQAGALGDFVVHVDDVVGRVLAVLEELDVAKDTVVIFSSDNGPLWFEPDVERFGHDSSGGLRGRKGDIWEGGVRVPLIVRWPGRVASGRRSSAVVGLVDLLATLAEVVGTELKEGQGVDSRSMLPIWLGEKDQAAGRNMIVLQSLGPNDLALRRGRWKLIPWRGSGGFLSRPARFDPADGEPAGQLYDLVADPGEMHNLYQQHPELVTELTRLLDNVRRSTASR